MRITPRSAEVMSVVEVLEDDRYESSRAMARDAFVAAAELLGCRQSWVVSHTWPGGGQGLNYGPFWSEAEANTFVTALAGAGGVAWVCRMDSPAAHLGNKKATSAVCQACGCPKVLHELVGSKRGQCRAEVGCTCSAYEGG